jgi:hypothetical protein
LSISDIDALGDLYNVVDGSPDVDIISEAALHQLAQSMATAQPLAALVTTSTGSFMSSPGANTPLMLVSG